jgi:hypothetical protein
MIGPAGQTSSDRAQRKADFSDLRAFSLLTGTFRGHEEGTNGRRTTLTLGPLTAPTHPRVSPQMRALTGAEGARIGALIVPPFLSTSPAPFGVPDAGRKKGKGGLGHGGDQRARLTVPPRVQGLRRGSDQLRETTPSRRVRIPLGHTGGRTEAAPVWLSGRGRPRAARKRRGDVPMGIPWGGSKRPGEPRLQASGSIPRGGSPEPERAGEGRAERGEAVAPERRKRPAQRTAPQGEPLGSV